MDPYSLIKVSKNDSKIDVEVEEQSNHQGAQERKCTKEKTIHVTYKDTRHKVSNNTNKTCYELTELYPTQKMRRNFRIS